MSKNLKKILVTGASLLMFASVGAGVSGIKANAKVVDGVHVANSIPTSALRKGGEYHQEFEFELAKVRQHEHHSHHYRSHSVKRHRARRATKRHARKRTRKAKRNVAKRIKRTARKHRIKRSRSKRSSRHTISMNRLNPSQQGHAFGIGVPANEDSTNVLNYLPVKANAKFNRSYLKGADYAFKNGKHQNARKAYANARLSTRSFDLVNNYARHSNANSKYITAWGIGFDANNLKSNAHFPQSYNKYQNSSKFMQAFAMGYMAKNGAMSNSQSSKLFNYYESLFD